MLIGATQVRSGTRGEPLVQVKGLVLGPRKHRNGQTRDAISFELRRGAALALVGEEGSGRRSLMRAVLGLNRFASGRVVLDQVDMGILSAPMTSRLRRRIAFVTGDDKALDPRMTLWDTVDEPLRAHLRLPRDSIAGHRETALKRVGLASHDGRTSVAALSAFDKRRLQVARAIVGAPSLAVIDEPLRGLDALAQWIIVDLLKDLRQQEGPAFLVITADMRVAQAIADDVMIFKDGKIVERGQLRDIVLAPKDGETMQLLAAASLAGRPFAANAASAEAMTPADPSSGSREAASMHAVLPVWAATLQEPFLREQGTAPSPESSAPNEIAGTGGTPT